MRTPVPLVRVVLRGQQALAEQRLHERQAGGLLERICFGDQDLVRELRVGDRVDGDRAEGHARDRTEALRAVLERQAILAEVQEVAEQREARE